MGKVRVSRGVGGGGLQGRSGWGEEGPDGGSWLAICGSSAHLSPPPLGVQAARARLASPPLSSTRTRASPSSLTSSTC